MAMAAEHTVKSFDEELGNLRRLIGRMGELAESQLQVSIQALIRRSAELAHQVMRDDASIDELDQQVAAQVVRLLALRQPVANDLRAIVASLKISSDLERIGDYAANIGKRVITLAQTNQFQLPASLPRMGWLAERILRDVLQAYAERDVAKAEAARASDGEIDETYNGLFRELLTHMMEDPRNIGPCTHLLFVARNIERIGDHATNIAESIHYMIKGELPGGARLKGDTTSFIAAPTEKAGA
jgi:phosphate transport system protein